MQLVKKNQLKKQFKNQLKKQLNIIHLTPYFVQIAISVVCSQKELRSNSHFVCERSEPNPFLKPLNLKISNTQTVKLFNQLNI